MILEHALLPVRPELVDEFIAAFGEARSIISGMPGCREVTLVRCIERPSTFLLLAQWERLEDHTIGFRGSPEYQRWSALLHHFYDPFPEVWHFEELGG